MFLCICRYILDASVSAVVSGDLRGNCMLMRFNQLPTELFAEYTILYSIEVFGNMPPPMQALLISGHLTMVILVISQATVSY